MARRPSTPHSTSKAEREFVCEAEEIIERMRGNLADLGDQRAAGPEVSPDLINGLFRSAHSLKALAGLFGFDPIRDLAHQLEDLLEGLRLGRVDLEFASIGLIDEAVRLFSSLLEKVGDAEALAEAGGAIVSLTARIEVASRQRPSGDDGFVDLDLDPLVIRALTEYEEHRLRENLQRGRHIVLVDSTFEIISFEEGLSELSAAIRAVGEVLSTLPAPGEAPESQIRFSVLAASDLPADEVSTRLDFPGASVRVVRRGREQAEASSVPSTPAGSADRAPCAGAGEGAAPSPAGAVGRAEVESLKSISDSVRVDIRKLDELMNLVGELVIQRSAIGDLIAQLVSNPPTARIGAQFAKVHNALNRKLQDLQTAVLDVRMVPLRQVFDKVSRVIRGRRTELGKDVELEIRGADTELDKLITEELVDPLMHVVRNSLDHGIEPVEERRAAGKGRQGRICIEAFQRGNHVVIAVSDDGGGIDTAALRASAEAAGLVGPDEELSEKETLDLIFAPGVSTRSEVTETSGRGFGMDVVRSNLTPVGGIIDVESTPGRGTTISMTLPITLAIIQSLIVSVAGQRFAIPLNAVLETLLLDPAEIQRSEGREIINLRGEPLTLRRLASEFDLEVPAADAKQFAVVLGIGGLRVGLLVDGLEGQQDTVIKPIQGPVPAVRGIAGATELGDQNAVLVLDVSALAEDAVRRKEAA